MWHDEIAANKGHNYMNLQAEGVEQADKSKLIHCPSMPPSLLPRKYVSQFRIDGAPILPPLMTSEKCRQMAHFREKAIRIENKLKERHLRNIAKTKNPLCDQISNSSDGNQLLSTGTPRSISSLVSSSSCGSTSQHSFEYEEERRQRERELNESFAMLSNMVQQPMYVDSSTCTLNTNTESSNTSKNNDPNLAERLEKLGKSETIIYDNQANTIIMPMMSNELDDNGLPIELSSDLMEAYAEDLDHSSSHSLQMVTTLPLKPQPIPSICIDPPTPLVGSNTIFTDLNVNVSISSEGDCDDDDEDEVSSNFDRELIDNLNTIKASQISGPQRSVTSPQLQLDTNTTSDSSFQITSSAGHEAEISYIRSNSFTLDGPSRALLDHLQRQQKCATSTGGRCTQSKTQNSLKTRRVLPSPSTRRDTIESKAKRVQKLSVVRSLSQRTPKKSSVGNYMNTSTISSPPNGTPSSGVRTKRPSPYDNKSNSKPKGKIRVIKKILTNPNSPPKQVQHSSKVDSKSTIKRKGSIIANQNIVLSEYEAEHEQKFLRLLEQQKEEQRRLQLTFERQQEQLLKQLADQMYNVHLNTREGNQLCSPKQKPAEAIIIPSQISQNYENHYNEMHNTTETVSPLEISTSSTPTSATNMTLISNSRCSPRRRLFGGENATSAVGLVAIGRTEGSIDQKINNECLPITVNSTKMMPLVRCQNDLQMKPVEMNFHYSADSRIAAATIINAYTRGFLVRRLFQTEQIQRIVQTIRDSLIFVLNLHMETMVDPEESNTPANVKLKARLLQQLSSATRTLHLFFFQTTVRERMDIIARDRKRIKTKLMSLNLKRSPRMPI